MSWGTSPYVALSLLASASTYLCCPHLLPPSNIPPPCSFRSSFAVIQVLRVLRHAWCYDEGGVGPNILNMQCLGQRAYRISMFVDCLVGWIFPSSMFFINLFLFKSCWTVGGCRRDSCLASLPSLLVLLVASVYLVWIFWYPEYNVRVRLSHFFCPLYPRTSAPTVLSSALAFFSFRSCTLGIQAQSAVEFLSVLCMLGTERFLWFWNGVGMRWGGCVLCVIGRFC